MPRTEDIISGLHAIANDHYWIAVVWHILFYLIIIALIVKWLPSNKWSAIFICLPLATVAILAWLSGNPFNGILFSVSAVLIFLFGLKASGQPLMLSQWPFVAAGILMIAFGLFYPHFIETNSWIKYLYASPAGLIPCPTLSVLIGFLLVYNGFGSQTIIFTFILLGLFYGLFGVFKLAVHLDLGLIFGTLVLIIKYIMILKL